MAINAAVQWECQSGGDDNNGGGFNPNASGTDYSQQTTAQATLTTASLVNATTTKIDVDSGDYTCTDNDVGNVIQIYGGTATAGFYEITARSAQQWTLDRACGTAGQTVVAKMGGCFGSPGGMSATFGNGAYPHNKFWIKSATYTLTNSTGATSGGPWNNNFVSTIQVEGYETTRGDRGTPPTLAAGTQTNCILWHQDYANQCTFINLKADGQSQTGVNGFDHDYGGGRCILCEAVNCDAATTNYGFQTGNIYKCRATNCGIGFDAGKYAGCIARSCNLGFSKIGDGMIANCLAFNCVNGITATSVGIISNCTVDNCTGYGIRSAVYTFISGCIISNCVKGYESGSHSEDLQQVAFYNNTSDGDTGEIDFDTIALTADPYNDSANDDYRLNETAGGGADCVVPLGVNGSNATIGALPQVTTPPATRHPLGRF
jgi:hypothetical protein